MRYVIVNNDYHVSLLEEHGSGIVQESMVIAIPHRLSAATLARLPQHRVVPSPLTVRFGCLKPLQLWRARSAMLQHLQTVGPGDVLILFTEYELLNQAFAREFRKRGGQVFLLEENGLASYACNKLAPHAKALWQTQPRWLLAQLLWGCSGARAVESDGQFYPIGKDEWLDGLVYLGPVTSARALPVYQLPVPEPDCSPSADASVALYLNQDIYTFFMSEDEYFAYLQQTIEELCQRFERVLFKFHPRELGRPIEGRIRAILGRAEVLLDASPVEELARKLPPMVVVSFMSSALVTLSRRGYAVEFRFRHWQHYRRSPMLSAIAEALDELGGQGGSPVQPLRPLASLTELG